MTHEANRGREGIGATMVDRLFKDNDGRWVVQGQRRLDNTHTHT